MYGPDTCFIIMPFKEELEPVADAIREGVDRAGEGLRCLRLDDLRHPGRITDDLVREIERAKVCIVDLSGLNPNVMWETGFAMSLKKPMIFLAQDTDNLPFDIRDFRVITYQLPAARRSLPSEIALALGERDRSAYRDGQSDSGGDAGNKGNPSPRARRLRISFSVLFLLVLIGISGLAGFLVIQRQETIMAKNKVIDELRGQLTKLDAYNGGLLHEVKRLQAGRSTESSLYHVFDFAAYKPEWRGMSQGEVAGGGRCKESWEWQMELGEHEIAAQLRRLNFAFICRTRNFSFDCGGGWNHGDPSHKGNTPGKVTADLRLVDGTVIVSNVGNPDKEHAGQCEQELVEFIKSKNGARVGS